MNLPIQARPIARSQASRRPLPAGVGGVSASCSLGDQIECCGLVVGMAAACATVETLVGIPPCVAAIVGYLGSDCEDCACGEPLKASICGWVSIINSIVPGTISPPSFC